MPAQSLGKAIATAVRFAFAEQRGHMIIVAFTPVGDNEDAGTLLRRSRVEAVHHDCVAATVFILEHDQAVHLWPTVVESAIADATFRPTRFRR